jgi:hypothetical protein
VQAFPTSPVVASLQLSCASSDPQFLLSKGVSSVQTVLLGGVAYPVAQCNALPPWRMLESYLQTFCYKLRMGVAARTKTAEDDVEDGVLFLRGLKAAYFKQHDVQALLEEMIDDFQTDIGLLRPQELADWLRGKYNLLDEFAEKAVVSNVDLDFSVSLFDKDWALLDYCGYDKLALGEAVVHSGDAIRAPYPHGARELVDIDMAALRQRCPSLAYLVLQVFSFSGCPYSSLSDASVFLGDPSLGSGPAGLNVLSACRLTGQGTTTIGAVVYFDEFQRPCFVNVDQTLDIDARTASNGALMVSTVCRKIFEERAAPVSKRLRAVDSAAMVAAVTSSKVVLVHGTAPEGVPVATVIERKEGKSAYDFYAAITKCISKGDRCCVLLAYAAHAAPSCSLSHALARSPIIRPQLVERALVFHHR